MITSVDVSPCIFVYDNICFCILACIDTAIIASPAHVQTTVQRMDAARSQSYGAVVVEHHWSPHSLSTSATADL